MKNHISSSLTKTQEEIRSHGERIIAVRTACIDIGMRLLECRPDKALRPRGEDVIAEAKKLETWVWGGYAPIEKAETPYTTIADAAVATQEKLQEFIDNCANESVAMKLNGALSMWERFKADISNAMEELGYDDRM